MQKLSVIHNSLRYDDKTEEVTFHLREEDWKELRCSSKIEISSRESTKVIICEPVSLAPETMSSFQQVDPVETFGLFARQTFTVVESNKNCQVLKVKGVLYIVNSLPILDLVSMGCSFAQSAIRFPNPVHLAEASSVISV